MKSKYNVGDTIYVAKCINGHEFEIGEKVLIEHITTINKRFFEYKCRGENDFWYLSSKEISLTPLNKS